MPSANVALIGEVSTFLPALPARTCPNNALANALFAVTTAFSDASGTVAAAMRATPVGSATGATGAVGATGVAAVPPASGFAPALAPAPASIAAPGRPPCAISALGAVVSVPGAAALGCAS